MYVCVCVLCEPNGSRKTRIRAFINLSSRFHLNHFAVKLAYSIVVVSG